MSDGDRVSAGEDEEFWPWVVVMAAQHCERASCHQTIHRKVADMIKMVRRTVRIFYHTIHLIPE